MTKPKTDRQIAAERFDRIHREQILAEEADRKDKARVRTRPFSRAAASERLDPFSQWTAEAGQRF